MLPCELNFELLTTCLKKLYFQTHLYQKNYQEIWYICTFLMTVTNFFFGRKYVRNSWVFLWSPLSLLFPNLINEIFDHISLISILGAIVLKIKWTTKNCHDNSNFFIGTAAGITNNSEKYRAQSFTSLKADLH